YVIAASGFAIQWLSIGSIFTYGVFFKYLAAEFGWSRATISGASSLAFLSIGVMAIFAGRLNDRFGPRIVMSVSAIILGVGYLLMSQLQVPWHIYLIYGVIIGTGMSSHDVVTLSTIARWFVRKRGMMTGIVKVGTGAGQLVVPLIASLLIAAYGWRMSYVILGAVTMVLFLAVAQFMRRDPRQMGLLPDGATSVVSPTTESAEEGLSLRVTVRTRQFWTVCLAQFAVIFSLLTIVIHIVPHATDLGLSGPAAAGILSAIGGVSMAGRFTMGTASDKIGLKRSLIICFVILIAGLLWLQVARELWMFYLFALVYGFAHGGFFTLVSPLIANLFGTKAHGAIFGMVYFVGNIGGAIGPLLAGYIFDITQSYQIAFWLIAGMSLVGLLVISSLKPLVTK
ncbi:MAG: MFS transporter, partial [Dehalococcoidales bacterium]